MSTVFATDLITTLQRNARRALAAEVYNGWAVDSHGAAESALIAKGVLGAHRGHLVGFAGHGWGLGWMCMDIAKAKVILQRFEGPDFGEIDL